MANAFLQLGKRRSDIKEFLKEASASNSIKYRAEKNKSHVILFPSIMVEDENGNMVPGVNSRSARVHEWEYDGKFASTVCAEGMAITDDNGNLITDGTCPFCDRIQSSWDIFNWRVDYEKEHCGKTGKELEDHIKSVKTRYNSERKLRDTKDYIYILVVQFNTDDRRNPVLDDQGIPTYELKIMRLSSKQISDIQTAMDNNGIQLAGSEIVFSYGSQDNMMNLVGERTITPVFPDNKITKKYPAVLEKINIDVEKFDWDGIEKAFPEWKVQTTAASKEIVKNMFKLWDDYKAKLAVDPNAQYMEYMGAGKSVSNPAIGGTVAGIGNQNQIGTGLPSMGALPQMGAMPGQAQAPTQAPAQTAAPTMPNMTGMPQMGAMPNMTGMPQMGATGMTGNGEVEI